jgi:hypothetical protein
VLYNLYLVVVSLLGGGDAASGSRGTSLPRFVCSKSGREGRCIKTSLHCTLGYAVSRARHTKKLYRTQNSWLPYLIEVIYNTFGETSHVQLFCLLDVDVARQVRGRCCVV